MANILVIVDELKLQKDLRISLEREGFLVTSASGGEQGVEIAKKEKPDLIILDLALPLLNGFDVTKTLRAHKDTEAIPIILLSSSSDVTDRIVALELGADDYLTKPFSPRELAARIKARLREVHRKMETKDNLLRWGDLVIMKESYTVSLADQPLNLTVKEFELLVLFVSNPYQVFSREYLIQKVWGSLSSSGTRALDVHISHLRNKLKPLGPVLDSVRGVGYTFTHRHKN
ncbi:response regulator with CheY-like receiver domain and winged-helix DNA-binding domain [Desulfosporosinus orientis DSM 765]|uniref:Stage 0 sporulation protein A homolog n=1 Tax=Desulfosporosinus orientis (strain ATCC 19365 / DSM 765 / NCIMB 8382 / VKM B-1628 / Singapore I) TaxID=768706 RepID=G7W993_DESOD|nr:response regulator transcription factor [Desulfosporosinus orientis]AET68734.1 response regulator with CheY-like receiver domain and winged-helix DNA-binding domain [Desulfosporosinus orientis DSM 765]